MSSLRTFRVVLSRDFDPEITSWNYTVANLPQARQTNAAGLVKCFSLVSSGTVQEIVLRFESAPSNRVTRKEPLDRLLLLSLADFRLRWPSKSPDDPPRVATGRENGDYVTRLLTTGVVLNGTHYHFFGHSNSQTKSRSCFMYGASKEDISAKIEAMGDLSKLKSVGKKAKRIGLLFSSAEAVLDLSPERCRDIDDVKRDDYVFTDGCGLISLQLARQLAQRRNIIHRNQRYLPSVFQIRYRGYKGVLTLDPTLQVFVTWDPDIIPRTMAQPAQYPGGKELVTFGEVTGDARAEYFARYTSASLGKVKNLYMRWARLGHAMSPQCQQLNRLFSQCVDGNHIRIPDDLKEFTKLEDPSEPKHTVAPFILDVLHDACTQLILQADNTRPNDCDEVDVMELFLARDKMAMSEFELLHLLLRWCKHSGEDILEYRHHLDFSALSDEQQIWFLSCLPPSATAPSLVRNGLLQSELVTPDEVSKFRLDQPHLHWKPVFRSSTDRMQRFLPTVSQALEIFHKKLIILTVDERLSVAIYVSKKIERASEVQVDTGVVVFAFPHSQGLHSPNYKMLPTKADDSLYRNEKNKGDKRRARETTVRDGVNFDCKASIALDKVGRGLQQHIGKVQQNGVLGAEIYVISNRDINSMRVLDEWLTFVDTDEVLPLFEKPNKNYDVPRLGSKDWADYPETVVAVVRDKDFAHLQKLKSVSDLSTMLGLLNDHCEKKMLLDTFSHVLVFEASSALSLDRTIVASTLLDFLPNAVYLIPAFFQSQTWETHSSSLEEHLTHLAFTLLRNLVLLSEEMGTFTRRPTQILLQEMKCISLKEFAEIVELIALTVRSSETALDFLLGVLEPETPRLLVGRPTAIRQFTSSLFGIALDHVDEASSARELKSQEFLELRLDGYSDGYAVVKGTLRIDSSLNGLLKAGDHCGSFVTSKTSFDAVTTFYTEREACSAIYAMLLGLPPSNQGNSIGIELPVTVAPLLNGSQNAALAASMKHSLTFIWGPPGTGKTHTIVVIITQLLEKLPKLRFLVTAPTHNAVDNMLRRFVAYPGAKNGGIVPVRVSTQLSKVAQDLRTYTCDAMVGKDLSANFPARRKAQKRIKEARLVFTTCTGAALGLLRNEAFDVVIIDEASQLTEPATLVPLVKGCSRAILVGDHVQLRATVQQTAVVTGYDVSLFERHYNLAPREGVAKVMLDTQYRMHRSICDFSSSEFYDGKLHTAVADNARPLPPSLFPWPKTNRMVWVECAAPEDLFQQSKSNVGQGEVCKRIIQLLKASPASSGSTAISKGSTATPTIAILTPYTRQKTLLTTTIPNAEVYSIDSFQGREADVIVFVTVRCNAHYALGFLDDMRRLNVVMTRAKAGVVLVGHKNTLTGVGAAETVDDSKLVWKRLLERCEVVELPAQDEDSGSTH
ncbi:hypothetical protein J4E81_004658 [Alternaria sp. BMP 2799]|nr:hypothetical protein J4E81_004658 [Alternaria sp. BMP 2799]